jgi:phosphoglycolate phosphatase
VSAAPATLLFDLDGTLTDNSTGIARSIGYALQRLDVEIPSDEHLRRCVGPPLRESFAWLLDTDDRAAIEQAIVHYRERFADIGWRENVVYPGIPEVLEALADNPGRVFLCTAKPEIFARRIVQLFGLSLHLHGIYGADLAGAFDDKVKLFAHIAQREGFAPEDGIMIGDRSHDLRAARMNGARAVGVLWGFGSREELAGADAIVATPAELPATLAALGLR